MMSRVERFLSSMQRLVVFMLFCLLAWLLLMALAPREKRPPKEEVLPQVADISPLTSLKWPRDPVYVTDVLDVAIFGDDWSLASMERPGQHYSIYQDGTMLSALKFTDDPLDWAAWLSLAHQRSTSIVVGVDVWESAQMAAKILADGYLCAGGSAYAHKEEFVRGAADDYSYCISYVRVTRDELRRKQYESFVMFRKRNLVVSIEKDTMMLANVGMQDTIDLVTKGLRAGSARLGE
jgi:hypothetical protein